MAINTINATIQMRKGLERDFDADQMTAGEWAVSTDTKYVRMCFATGIVLRMATYEGFELDMAEIQNILKECQDIQKAVDAMAKAAEKSKTDADKSAKLSESWAKGGTGVRVGENTNNSKYYSDQAKTLTDEASDLLDQAQNVVVAATQGALIPGGTVTFEDLPSNPAIGYMYNISNDFTTDSRFMEGSGIFYSAGANVYWTADGKWDVMVGTQVTGIKGANQTSYQKGNVSLSADDIGAVGTGGDISSNTVTFEQAVERAGITSGDTMSVAFGKLAKYCADLESGVLNGLAGNVQNQLDLGALRLKKDLGTAGWYRILFFGEGIGSAGPVSPSGISVDLTLCRNYNYSQAETVVMTIETGYSEPPICVVHDRNAYDTHQAFRDIRIVWDPESKGCWLEIFYNTNQTNTCSAYLSVKDAYLSNFRDRVVNFDPVETTNVTLIWQYSIPITKDVKTNGLRKIYTGDINIDDYFDAAHVGSYGHHSGTLSGIPSGLSGVGVWDTEYSIGDGDSKYLKQTYRPYDKSIFAQRIKNANTVTPWSVFYPGEEVFKSPRQDLKNVDILNTVMAPGLYWVRKSDGNTGLPRDNIYYGFLVVYGQLKKFISWNDLCEYTSIRANSEWLPWEMTGGSETAGIYNSSYISIYDNILYGSLNGRVLTISSVFTIAKNMNSGEYVIYLPAGYTFSKNQQVIAIGLGNTTQIALYCTAGSNVLQCNGNFPASGNSYYVLNAQLLVDRP